MGPKSEGLARWYDLRVALMSTLVGCIGLGIANHEVFVTASEVINVIAVTTTVSVLLKELAFCILIRIMQVLSCFVCILILQSLCFFLVFA